MAGLAYSPGNRLQPKGKYATGRDAAGCISVHACFHNLNDGSVCMLKSQSRCPSPNQQQQGSPGSIPGWQ
jgi:hypothetical protein